MPLKITDKQTRVARIYPDATTWLMDLPDEWDDMTEGEREWYIYECAMDNGKVGDFTYEEVQP